MTVFRRALLALSVVLLALVPAGLVAGAAEAAPKVPVGGGSAITLGGNGGCTMTTVGRDRGGNLLGLTAAHCGKVGALVTAPRHRNAAIGRVVLRSTGGDYAVISLDANRVRPVRAVGKARISGVGRFPDPGAIVCKMGRTTGFTCGPVLAESKYLATSYVCSNYGDSGGPILSGTRLVGMLNGGQRVAGVHLPCADAAVPIHTPMIATKMTDILSALNRYGRVGAGFRPI